MEVIQEALREGYHDFCVWAMPNWSQQKSELTDRFVTVSSAVFPKLNLLITTQLYCINRLVEGKLELCLAIALDDHLLPLLAAQGLTYNVHVVKKGEDRYGVVRGLCKLYVITINIPPCSHLAGTRSRFMPRGRLAADSN